MGGIVEMVRDPFGFWEKQRVLNAYGVSKFSLLGKLVLFSTDTDVSRRILTHNGPDALEMARARSTIGSLLAVSLSAGLALPPCGPGCRGLPSLRRICPLQAVHPSGKWILGPNNLAFMHGPEHKALRKSFLSLFTPKALSIYVAIQARATPIVSCSAPRRATAAAWRPGRPGGFAFQFFSVQNSRCSSARTR